VPWSWLTVSSFGSAISQDFYSIIAGFVFDPDAATAALGMNVKIPSYKIHALDVGVALNLGQEEAIMRIKSQIQRA
jgi:hypothetical protein